MELAERVFSQDHRIVFIKNSKNLGFGEGNNVGFRESKGPYVVFLNNDVIVDPEWLSELVDGVRLQQEIVAAQCKLLLLDNKRCIESAGDYINTLGFSFSRGRGQLDVGQFDRIEDIFSARGAAMLVKRTAFEAIGGFDSLFFLQYDDIDLGWRIRLRGYRIIFVPRSVVFHAGGASISRIKPSSILFHEFKGYLLTTIKNYEGRNLMRFNPAVALIGGLIPDIFLRKNALSVLARLMAFRWLIADFQRVVGARRQVQERIRRVPDSEIAELIRKTTYAETLLNSLYRKF
jgi:GT2 family glycosyltransferase